MDYSALFRTSSRTFQTAALLTCAGLAACGGGGGKGGSTPSTPVPSPSPSPGLLSVTPATAAFESLSDPPVHIAVTQPFETAFTLSAGTCSGIVVATYAAPAPGGAAASVTVAPAGAGTCALTVAGGGAQSQSIAVTVTTTQVINQSRGR